MIRALCQGPKTLIGQAYRFVGRSRAKRQPTSTRLLVGCRFALDRPTKQPFRPLVFCLLALLVIGGCDNMANQPRDKTWQPANALPDRKVWPPQPAPHTIAREDVAQAVPALTAALIERGHRAFRYLLLALSRVYRERRRDDRSAGFPGPALVPYRPAALRPDPAFL